MLRKKDWNICLQAFEEMHPHAHCELVHRNPFELLIATLLSAQATDKQVNKVTASLFQKYREPEDFVHASIEEIENDIRSIGLYRNKAKNIRALSEMLLTEYGGEVPRDRDELTKLPGVGRKTANVVVSNAFGVPAFAVDTHVERVAKRLGMCRWKDNVRQVEEKLTRWTPEEEWTNTHHRMIFWGRYHCKAQRPNCPECPLLDLCREGKKRMKREYA